MERLNGGLKINPASIEAMLKEVALHLNHSRLPLKEIMDLTNKNEEEEGEEKEKKNEEKRRGGGGGGKEVR